jgi:hypothetical protein
MPYEGAKRVGIQRGLAKHVALKLADALPHGAHTIVMDNWYTSLDLLHRLDARGKGMVGTLRHDRARHITADMIPLVPEKGDCVYKMAAPNFLCLAWHDNGICLFLSNCCPATGHSTIIRRKIGEVDGTCRYYPPVAELYNQGKGWVDSHNKDLVMCKFKRAARKWWHPLFWDYMDECRVSSWKIMQLDTGLKKTQEDYTYELVLHQIGGFSCVKRGPQMIRPNYHVCKRTHAIVKVDYDGKCVCCRTDARLPKKLRNSNCRFMCITCKHMFHEKCFYLTHYM